MHNMASVIQSTCFFKAPQAMASHKVGLAFALWAVIAVKTRRG